MNHRLIFALLVSFCIFVSGLAQTKPSDRPSDDKDDVVKITTNLVQIDAVVTKNGKPVTNLTADDFEIYEDGKKQTITSFAYISNISNVPSSGSRDSAPPPASKKDETSVPPVGPIQRDVARRTIGIVVDDLGISAESMAHVRSQVRKFIAEQVQPNDLIAIIRTGGQMGALQQFTNEKRMLNRAVERLRWNPCSRLGMATLSREEDPRAGGCFYNSVEQTLKAVRFVLDAMGQLPGRKSMILMSDDIPIRREEARTEGAEQVLLSDVRNYGGWLQKLTETAIRSSVVIYSVDTQGLQYTGITAADAVPSSIYTTGGVGSVPERSARLGSLSSSRSRVLQERREGSLRLAERTGGFQIHNSNGFQLDRILEDQSGYYLLGYRPSAETFNRKFHQIKAKVNRSGMTLRTRFGFYGVTEEEANRTRPTITDQTNLALLSPFGAQDLELELNSFFSNDKSAGSIIRSFIYLDPASLSFTSANGRRETPLQLHGVVFGDNGVVIDRVKRDVVLSLAENEYQQALRDGLRDAVRLRFDLPAKNPGSYQVRIAVRDLTSAKIGSAGQFVVVPNLNDKGLPLSGIVLRETSQTSTPAAAMAIPPARRFAANTNLYFGFMTYNASISPATRLPDLMMETKLFRDGKIIGSPSQTPIEIKNQLDLSRLFINGAFRLAPDLEPGNYFLQIAITDKASRDKQPSSTQWVGFEIVK
ncbi:MAG TPA: VWA domain-containing protein [Pyrinomonadaceae bacterium]|nr:VWA domain-containing protein [Pyrinomonadaceae bacterium]